ncbi:skin secretory protein xP2-like [Caloenas nicobarica]|uniref:skin secretory protein xP2-like n=1 Tax=Caloenas nicobarica TaxID=187106 RepID=UPI0032B7E7AF
MEDKSTSVRRASGSREARPNGPRTASYSAHEQTHPPATDGLSATKIPAHSTPGQAPKPGTAPTVGPATTSAGANAQGAALGRTRRARVSPRTRAAPRQGRARRPARGKGGTGLAAGLRAPAPPSPCPPHPTLPRLSPGASPRAPRLAWPRPRCGPARCDAPRGASPLRQPPSRGRGLPRRPPAGRARRQDGCASPRGAQAGAPCRGGAAAPRCAFALVMRAAAAGTCPHRTAARHGPRPAAASRRRPAPPGLCGSAAPPDSAARGAEPAAGGGGAGGGCEGKAGRPSPGHGLPSRGPPRMRCYGRPSVRPPRRLAKLEKLKRNSP